MIFGPLTWRLFSSTLSGLADYDSIAFEGRPHLFTARCPYYCGEACIPRAYGF